MKTDSLLASTKLSPEVKQLQEHLYELTEVYRKHQQYIKTRYKISSLDMEIIQLIVMDGPKKMKEIGDHFQIKLSTLTSIIDKIEDQKFVKRVNSKDDRRVVFLEVSRKGRNLYEQYHQYLTIMAENMKESLSQDEFTGFLVGLKRMAEVANPVE
ncbi:MAG: MarR family winged helix-turn-helix transcriptional regulator [Bacteroidia bacterium]|nr:MarR family winged helix-turn-helix transcriptional regulator [Bacteroidia bacterium]